MLPAEPRVADHDAHWRVENGVLAVGPRVPDPRLDVIVVLEGAAGAKVPALPNATVELHGLRLDPRVSVIPVGGSVEFKNDDRVPHTLYVEKATTLMPATPTPAGQARTQKFYAAGEYRVRDEEYPHIDGTVSWCRRRTWRGSTRRAPSSSTCPRASTRSRCSTATAGR